jgi:general secretion pathway protein G
VIFPLGRRSRPFSRFEVVTPVRSKTVARSRRAGFTLIEILVVIVVLAVLATLVAPNVFRHVGSARDATARSQIEMFGAALDAYRLDNGRYPTSEQGLAALWREPSTDPRPRNWRGPYLRREVPLDPWGFAYVYRAPGDVNPATYDLLSWGADGRDGGDGENTDITSWQSR